MWNLSTTKNNDIYSIHCKVEAQKKHLYNLNHAKPIVDNKLPWMPYRIYSEKTKTKDDRNREIYYNNRLLLHKMEKIDGKAGALNPRSMLKTNEEFQKYHQYGIISKRINYHKKIENENMNILKRLHSARTIYGKQKFTKDFQQNEIYKKNFSKTNKFLDIDYTTLVKKNHTLQPKKIFMKTEDYFAPNINSRPLTAPKLLTK